jgi:hypothetical protein
LGSRSILSEYLQPFNTSGVQGGCPGAKSRPILALLFVTRISLSRRTAEGHGPIGVRGGGTFLHADLGARFGRRREFAPQRSPMGFYLSALLQLTDRFVAARTAAIGGLPAEEQTPCLGMLCGVGVPHDLVRAPETVQYPARLEVVPERKAVRYCPLFMKTAGQLSVKRQTITGPAAFAEGRPSCAPARGHITEVSAGVRQHAC